MKTLIDWVTGHTLTTILILGSAYSVIYVLANYKSLLYKK